MEIVTLVMVLLTGEVTTETRTIEFRGDDALQECKLAQGAARRAVQYGVNVLDVGTICVKSKFDPGIKQSS